jgi:hypothetical protein
MHDILEKIIKVEPFIGEDGLDYNKVTKEISTPRKTYLKGTITGKYRGDRISNESDLFDFEIYEAEVLCNSIEDFRKNRPFVFPNDFKNIDNQKKIKGTVFPKEKLPTTLPVAIIANEKSFGVNVLEPQLFEFDIVRKFHQTDIDDVFGTFNAFITGYVFDYEKKIVEVIDGPIVETDPLEVPEEIPSKKPSSCQALNIKTGETQTKGNYTRSEYYCKNHNDKTWGNWEYKNNDIGTNQGCFSSIIGIIGLILGVLFLITILPGILYFIGFFIIMFLISILAPYLKWIMRVIGVLLLIGFISSLINTFNQGSQRYIPTPVVVDKPREVVEERSTIIDTTNNQLNKNDTLITRYRIWQDYEGKKYEGSYQLRLSDLKNATYHKNNLPLSQNNIDSYDKIIYSLKENDKNKLNGVYKLFDSINKSNKLSKVKFAEMIVSFIQDIPYALILDKGCDASLYNDTFTRQYLLDPNASCDGNQRFGINTPVEFLASLKGDCDSRTVLLYTIFAHYNYDVAVLSSEFYGHSILGINLPINGTAYNYNENRYVMWETTTPNCKPGIISNKISNLNNWRISLKSK